MKNCFMNISSEMPTADAAKVKAEFPGFGCVIMASGLGRRFGGNKLMAELGGKPMIQWILDATEGLFERRVVVTRSPEVFELCKSYGVPAAIHDYPGRNDTVRLGLEALSRTGKLRTCMFCLGDQPFLKRETIRRILEKASEEGEESSIWRPECRGIVGTPVLFPQWTFPELQHLPEDQGGSVVIRQYLTRVKTVAVTDPWELEDIDTQEKMSAARQKI